MNYRILGLLVVVMIGVILVPSLAQEEDPYEEGSGPFYAKDLVIEWKVPDGRLPKTVSILHVRPQTFSPAVVSNALRLGSLTLSNRVEAHLKTKGALLFEKGFETLSIAPSLATIYYNNGNAETRPVVRLPSSEQIRELALKWLPALGIDPAQLQTVSDSGKPIVGHDSRSRIYFDKATKQQVRQLYGRSIGFRRVYEGIPFGWQGFRMDVGHEGEIQQLDIKWQNLQPGGTNPVASPSQLMTWIKEGRARVSSAEATGMDSRKVSQIRKLIITDATVRYFDAGSEMRQKKYVPYGVFLANAHMKEGIEIPISICCPVVSVELPKAKRDANATFNFWPAGDSGAGLIE